ncbi:hypothetical protein SODALDRAFT_78983 [Sodiomyces alkalinus F11]|uniref:Uncharacterized protein n=1 Tax=Sodiomyces alkalinus (strain CBS 110278 / VKM F-3762 / F11) TaxID=1314773 RepID=A0A3N2PL85_SODAK|nr:hypothetical protein SODALDRAFT_78983 [Sodiomyces alkalinus F11]ROT35180.1 hypothetical protein SODALDRAFT_78983 [Sodiomyces alkalinus F11]
MINEDPAHGRLLSCCDSCIVGGFLFSPPSFGDRLVSLSWELWGTETVRRHGSGARWPRGPRGKQKVETAFFNIPRMYGTAVRSTCGQSRLRHVINYFSIHLRSASEEKDFNTSGIVCFPCSTTTYINLSIAVSSPHPHSLPQILRYLPMFGCCWYVRRLKPQPLLGSGPYSIHVEKP